MKERQFITPIQRFIKAESFSGILLFATTILALILSNSIFSDSYQSIWQYKVGIQGESFHLIKPLILWINDGLMAIFFFLIGLEIKREVMIGELNSIKKASLPIFAAIGGMVVPVAIFFMLNSNPETNSAWGATMATDIAFTLAILSLLGKRVPLALKIFLTAFAIIDDIGAVMVIAIFYSSQVSWTLIIYALLLLIILYGMSYFKVYSNLLLLIFGTAIWLLFLKSGIHPTLAGILVAFSVPIRQEINENEFVTRLQSITSRLLDSTNRNSHPVLTAKQIEEIDNLEDWTNKVQSPIQQLEHRLHKWIAFMVMPVFAFANAGVHFSKGMEVDTALSTNIAIALVVGKTLGVSLFSYLAIRFKFASLQPNTTIRQIIGIAVLSGVGFTMSLFIGGLAFEGQEIYFNSAKIGIIAASVVSGIIGFLILRKSAIK